MAISTNTHFVNLKDADRTITTKTQATKIRNNVQATVSRDIKRLNLIKKVDPSGVRYYTFNTDENSGDAHTVILLRHSILEIKTAGNLVVIKCKSGMGNAVCEAIDDMNLPDMIGSIAGDNTIFIATENNEKAQKLAETIVLIY